METGPVDWWFGSKDGGTVSNGYSNDPRTEKEWFFLRIRLETDNPFTWIYLFYQSQPISNPIEPKPKYLTFICYLQFCFHHKQGRVRTKTVKRASKVLIEKYYPRLTLDFQTNKKIASEVAIIPSKRLRNKIAGFTTHLMKRIQRGPVRGISFKLQEEERERKDNYIPEFSALDTSAIEIDTDTQALLKSLNFEDLAGVTAVEVKQATVDTFRKPRGDRKERA
ncbi:40S ribosomal protein S17 [Linnemannia gamsii]|uniref:40S ribosomal protein S17 n=1 Tax=Linnemannia gamsii TaxID=64522 RepID=A0ABQ7JWC7_9FUNG|nr:40S ribosomal protein S17 [Linnemannia gamsii]